MHERQVILYESQKINEHEYNYVTHYLDLVAIIHALKMWIHYLLGRRFISISDCNGLSYLFDQTILYAKKKR